MSRAVTGFIDKLRAIVGDKGLITDDAGKHPYLTDWRDNYLGRRSPSCARRRRTKWLRS